MHMQAEDNTHPVVPVRPMGSPRFDAVLGIVGDVLQQHQRHLPDELVINRDLYGRVRLLAPAEARQHREQAAALQAIADELESRLGAHGYPAERALIWEHDLAAAHDEGFCAYPLPDAHLPGVIVVDRFADGSSWSNIVPVAEGSSKRIVYYSLEGGVGRSTALAVTARHLAEQGLRVLVADLDLPSPTLSTTLLPAAARPPAGVVDWLAEDLVGTGEPLLPDLHANLPEAGNGAVVVLPAHGSNPGDYLGKLGRITRPRVREDGTRETWAARVDHLLTVLERRHRIDVTLIDACAGLDRIAADTIATLRAHKVLLFATAAEHTWDGYQLLLSHWRTAGTLSNIGGRLQFVATQIPPIQGAEDLRRLNMRAEDLLNDALNEASSDSSTTHGRLRVWPVAWDTTLIPGAGPLHEASQPGHSTKDTYREMLHGIASFLMPSRDSRS